MLAKILSSAVVGLDCETVEVEVNIGGMGGVFIIVGLPDKAVEESRERVRLAIKNSGLEFPRPKVVINLAPAELKKEGGAYDLPIALGILLGSGQVKFDPKKSIFIGELSLDGKLRAVKGVLPTAIFARQKGFKTLYLPAVNKEEASLVKGLEITPLESLSDLVLHLRGEKVIAPFQGEGIKNFQSDISFEYDMAYVKGQEHVKRALEIAAAGAHNLLMSGPPGAGKTLLARAMPSILPRMNEEEILEVTKIYSVAGKLPAEKPLILERPFRTPHHTSSGVALVGGGAFPKPGEISLAHRGVLFLDEFPEFSRAVLENLRQPIEDGVVTVSRASGSITFPARFTLIASQNPCPCGYLSDPAKDCICTPSQILKYKKRISGPLLDRIDLYLEVPRLKFEKLSEEKVAESSKEIRYRVEQARERQKERFKKVKIVTNTEIGPKEIKEYCQIDDQAKELLGKAVQQLHLSARGYHRILKVSRTIADLAGSEHITLNHLAEALQYRQKLE